MGSLPAEYVIVNFRIQLELTCWALTPQLDLVIVFTYIPSPLTSPP